MLSPVPDLPGAVPARRILSGPSWFGRPAAYAVGSPILSILGAGTMIVAPWLLAPSAFGAFSLLSSLQQFAGRTDFGLSQLADRDLSGGSGAGDPDRARTILRARWILGAVGLVTVVPAAALWAWASGRLSPLDTALALFAGIAGMVAVGPVTIHRAQGRIREFTALSLFLQAGMTAPRLGGLLLGGVTGCFAAMAAWLAMGAVLAPTGRPPGPVNPVLPLMRAALPMFAFSWLWLSYLLANRWLASLLSGPTEFGLFAFGANLSFTALGILVSVAQLRYPAVLAGARLAACPRRRAGIAREAVLLALALAAVVACLTPCVAPAVDWAFPRYQGGEVAAAILGIACVPVGVAAWYMPVAVALTRSPVAEAVRTLGPAFAVLGTGMALGDAWAGIDGQAWGCVASGLTLLAGLIATLRRLGILDWAGGLRLMAVTSAACLLLAGLGLAILPDASGPSVAAGGKAGPEDRPLALEDRLGTGRLPDRSGGAEQPSAPSGTRGNRLDATAEGGSR